MHRARRECCQNDSPQNVIDIPYIKEMEKTSHRQPFIELYMKHYRKQVYLYTTGKHNYSIDTKREIVVILKMSDLGGSRWDIVM